jgi:integrase
MPTSSLLVPAVDVEMELAAERRREFAAKAKAEGTWKVYDGHWGRFVAYCQARGLEPGPPSSAGTVADWIIELQSQGRAKGTLSVAVAAVAHRNRLAGAPSPLDHPQVREVLAGAKRMAARSSPGRGPSEPLLPADLRAIVARLKPGLGGIRDLALLTFGFAGGFRREELCRLELGHLRFDPDGIIVHLPWSKGDQEGEGHDRRIARGDHLELCPVRNLQLWLSAAGIQQGPLFRPIHYGRHVTERPLSPRRVDQIVREYTRIVINADPGLLPGRKYSAHSLRSGLCTSAALAGKSESEIRDHVGHKSAQTTAKYIRASKIRMSTVTKGIGL